MPLKRAKLSLEQTPPGFTQQYFVSDSLSALQCAVTLNRLTWRIHNLHSSPTLTFHLQWPKQETEIWYPTFTKRNYFVSISWINTEIFCPLWKLFQIRFFLPLLVHIYYDGGLKSAVPWGFHSPWNILMLEDRCVRDCEISFIVMTADQNSHILLYFLECCALETSVEIL